MNDKDLKELLKRDIEDFSHEGTRIEWAGINERISSRYVKTKSESIISIISAVTLVASLFLVFNLTHNRSLQLTDQELENLEEFYLEDNYLDEAKELYTWVE